MNIGVFFGSRNTEHDISIITAQLIISTLKGLNYTVTPVYISKKGEWLIGDELGSLFSFTDPKKNVTDEKKFTQYFLDLENSSGKLVFRKKGLSGKTVQVDLAFPALHGAYGEDGSIQGIFEMFNVPYVGCGVAASAIAMDKALTKQIMKADNIPTTKFLYLQNSDWEADHKAVIERVKKELKFPVFVKPVHGGSSIGIAKVKDLADLENKIEVAFYYDDKVIVEEGVSDLADLTCCVIGNDQPQTSLVQESVFAADLFDFEEKYLKDGGAQLGKSESGVIIPARVDEATKRKVQEMAKAVYKALGCTGIARVDFLCNKKTNELFANEVNPLPGTLYHHLWKASGVEVDKLVEKLIDFAKEVHGKKQKVNQTFESSVLSNLNSTKLKSKKLQPNV